MIKPLYACVLAGLLALGPVTSLMALTPKNPTVKGYLADLEKKVAAKEPGFKGFSAERGKEVYFKEHVDSEDGDKRSCVVCHKKDPMYPSKHAVTGKPIDPLSPKINRERFTKVRKIEKWFRRNCKWTFERQCTAKEKGDFIEYIYSL